MVIPLSRPDITSLEKRYVMEVMDSAQLSLGEKVRRFESLFCQTFAAAHAVATNSGTSALHIAVKALGLGRGDEVITTPYSFIASGNCLLYEGVKPVFVDIDPQTLNMDTSQIEQKMTSRTKAVLAVHIFGQPCNMDEIMRLPRKYGLAVIEDACEAIGAEWRGKPAGLLGDVGVFAFYPNKQITTGEGGILLTQNEHIHELAASLRNQGRGMGSAWLEHERIGYNYRMSELQAAVGVAQLERLDEILGKREAVARRYIHLLDQYQLPVSTPFLLPESKISWFVFIVRLPQSIDRDQLLEYLLQQGIQTKPYFPSIHLQPGYQQLFGFKQGDFPMSEEASQRTLAIPFHSNLTAAEQEKVIKELAAGLQEQQS